MASDGAFSVRDILIGENEVGSLKRYVIGFLRSKVLVVVTAAASAEEAVVGYVDGGGRGRRNSFWRQGIWRLKCLRVYGRES